jgi:hypothetical protein
MHQWYWSYQYTDFLHSDGDFVEFDSFKSSIPSLDEQVLSLNDPNPPVRVNNPDPSDSDWISRLGRQSDHAFHHKDFNRTPYNSSLWPENMVLNLSLRNRVIELAKQ